MGERENENTPGNLETVPCATTEDILGTRKQIEKAAGPVCELKLPGFTDEQMKSVNQWLFHDDLTYAEVVSRCQKRFKLKTNNTALCRYAQRVKCQKVAAIGSQRRVAGAMAWRLGISADELYHELIETAGTLALEAVRGVRKKKKNMNVREVAELLRLQVSVRREANEAQRVALAREKLEFDAASVSLVHQREIQRITDDELMDEGERIRAIREELFGKNLPD